MEKAIFSSRMKVLDGFNEYGRPVYTCIYTPETGDSVVITLKANYGLERIGLDARARFVELLRARYRDMFENLTFVYVNEDDTTTMKADMERLRVRSVKLIQQLKLPETMERQIISTMPGIYDGTGRYITKICQTEYRKFLNSERTIRYIMENYLDEFLEYIGLRPGMTMGKLAYMATEFIYKKHGDDM